MDPFGGFEGFNFAFRDPEEVFREVFGGSSIHDLLFGKFSFFFFFKG